MRSKSQLTVEEWRLFNTFENSPNYANLAISKFERIAQHQTIGDIKIDITGDAFGIARTGPFETAPFAIVQASTATT